MWIVIVMMRKIDLMESMEEYITICYNTEGKYHSEKIEM